MTQLSFVCTLIISIHHGFIHDASGIIQSAPGWENKWKRLNLNIRSHADAQGRLDDLLKLPNERSVGLAEKNEMNKYSPLNFEARMLPLCRLFFSTRSQNLETKQDYMQNHDGCTCSFIKPTLAITSAHCFIEKQKQILVRHPEYTVYVVPQYGNEQQNNQGHQRQTIANARKAVEVWYPEAYLGRSSEERKAMIWTKERRLETGYDFAFVRTDPDHPYPSTFDLILPEGDGYCIFGREGLALGYPFEFKRMEVAVQLKGKFVGLAERSFGKLPGGEEEEVFGNQYLFQTNTVNGFMKASWGTMGYGGSGGPLVLSDDGLKKFVRNGQLYEKLKRGVFGVFSNGDIASDDQRRRGYSGMPTQRLLGVVEKLFALPSTPGAVPADNKGVRINGHDPKHASVDLIEFL